MNAPVLVFDVLDHTKDIEKTVNFSPKYVQYENFQIYRFVDLYKGQLYMQQKIIMLYCLKERKRMAFINMLEINS